MQHPADPARTNTYQCMTVLQAKSRSHRSITQYAIGEAIKIASTTSCNRSIDKRPMISGMLAPNTFLIPISFTRWSAAKVTSPNSPRQATKMARTEKPMDHIRPVKIFSGRAFRYNKGMRFFRRRRRISGNKGQGKHIEQRGIGIDHFIFLEMLISFFD
jgi:hypothetical protein